ncbi:MAG: HD domain-containing phosphohydrolase, partial [Methylophilus sp.]
LAGEDIAICSRIIAIADGYDAIAMRRSYHRARAHAEVMAIMQEENGSKYDSDLMQVFCKLISTSQYKASEIEP